MPIKDNELLSKNCFFVEHGWVVVENIVPKSKLLALRLYLVQTMLEAFGPGKVSGQKLKTFDLDALFYSLSLSDKQVLDLIKVTKNSLPFYSIMADPSLLKVVKVFLKSNCVHSIHDIAQFRIDTGRESSRNFDWHQDYPYNQTSVNAITSWIPLTNIFTDIGPLKIIPGSHHARVSLTKTLHRKQGVGDTNKVIKFEFDELLLTQVIDTPNMSPGDVLFLHSKVLHKSGENICEDRARWVHNARYSDSLEQELIDRNWLSVNDRNIDEMLDRYVIEHG